MQDIIETPCAGVNNKPIVNRSESHLPCILVIDTSFSVEKLERDIIEGIRIFFNSLDDEAKGVVETCIITFDDDARVLVPFGPTYDYPIPSALICKGMTSMGKAGTLAIDEAIARLQQYEKYKVHAFNPWMFFFTDGKPNDNFKPSFGKLNELVKHHNWNIFPVAIGEDADVNTLKDIRPDNCVLTVSEDNFKNTFSFISASISKVTISKPGDTITMPNPSDYQLTVTV